MAIYYWWSIGITIQRPLVPLAKQPRLLLPSSSWLPTLHWKHEHRWSAPVIVISSRKKLRPILSLFVSITPSSFKINHRNAVAKNTQFSHLSILRGLSVLPLEVTHQRQNTSQQSNGLHWRFAPLDHGDGLFLWPVDSFFYKHFGGAWGDDGFFQLRNQYNQPRRDNETNEIIGTMTAIKSYSTKTINEMTIWLIKLTILNLQF